MSDKSYDLSKKSGNYYQMFYGVDSPTGSFWDSRGYKRMRQEAYEKQREQARRIMEAIAANPEGSHELDSDAEPEKAFSNGFINAHLI